MAPNRKHPAPVQFLSLEGSNWFPLMRSTDAEVKNGDDSEGSLLQNAGRLIIIMASCGTEVWSKSP